MDKKAMMKKACGKGGLSASYLRQMQRNDDKKIDLTGKKLPSPFQVIGGAIKGGIQKYKNYAAKEKSLNDAASKEIGNVSSNQYNMDRMRKIKNKLRNQ